MLTNSNVISLKISELETALLKFDPLMPTRLREIHKLLQADPEVVTLLTPDQVRIIVNGLERQTKTELAETVSKSVKKTKTPKNLTVDDI